MADALALEPSVLVTCEFESRSRYNKNKTNAPMAELVDAMGLRLIALYERAGSSPARGTKIKLK